MKLWDWPFIFFQIVCGLGMLLCLAGMALTVHQCRNPPEIDDCGEWMKKSQAGTADSEG